MDPAATLFLSTFTTLLAIIYPLESLPVFLKLLDGKDEQTHRRVARRACSYATLLLLPGFWHVAVEHLRGAAPREGTASLHKGGFAARLSEIAQAHPEAERFEIWSQDEARVGQKGRTGYVWWQRGQTPRAARCRFPIGLDHRGRVPGARHRRRAGDDAG